MEHDGHDEQQQRCKKPTVRMRGRQPGSRNRVCICRKRQWRSQHRPRKCFPGRLSVALQYNAEKYPHGGRREGQPKHPSQIHDLFAYNSKVPIHHRRDSRDVDGEDFARDIVCERLQRIGRAAAWLATAVPAGPMLSACTVPAGLFTYASANDPERLVRLM